ncbi:cobalt-precorrin 5A hydrolase [Neorhizobium huautlense]|uniref:Cobalt-precorrin 5A hydrolase n=1 Tax=Neorhizobium huautlense TaxID=67774 RepID=A0ABT9PS99_9HYPH|nr:cobalamin biosynthesis protein [Neorhizobium huautlense]MDP9837329.1 cobalt-precorrin 5A hydrolase [Neorhizobium huautlense]
MSGTAITRRIVAGIGCRKDTPAETILHVLTEALETTGLDGQIPDMLATGGFKADEAGIIEAARKLGIPMVVVEQAALASAAPRTLTVSEMSLAHAGTPSLCEAAALAAAGETAMLAAPRYVRDGVTCAIAISHIETRKT